MAKLIAAMASSHAYKFLEPSVWDKRRFGVEPADQPQVTEETLEANEARYQKIYDGLSFVRQRGP